MSALPVIVKTSPSTDAQRLNLVVHIAAEVLSADAARRRANGWLLDNVGNLLMADTPELVIGETLVWRVPVILTSPTRGHVGILGTLDLDATSGQPLAESATIERLHARAAQFAQG